MRIGSLFSGIGGLELGLEWAGVGEVVWQCEIDPFCRRVLAKHWPNVTRYEDVRELHPSRVDVLCGGFPCQDVSSGNTSGAKGLAGERSGLWYEFRRIVEEIAPPIVVVENVAGGARRWLPFVRRDLHVLGYRTRAYALSASDVGALHRRRRVFVVAHADSERGQAGFLSGRPGSSKEKRASLERCVASPGASSDAGDGRQLVEPQHAEVESASRSLADVDGAELRQQSRWRGGTNGSDSSEPSWAGGRFTQPDLVRVVHGFSRGLDGRRRRALGNAVVPQCAEVIGRIIREEISS